MLISRIAILLITLSVVGCATPPSPIQVPIPSLADGTTETLNKYFAAEREHLKGRNDHPDGVPLIGLAMSGGGTKAAVFAHGVLHGLQEQRILPAVDLISTASGGGYASYWYMSKLMEAERLKGTENAFEVKDIFRDCFPAWLVAGLKPSDVKDDSAINLQQAKLDGVAASRLIGQEVCRDENNFSEDGKDRFRWQAHIMRWPDVMREKITVIDGGSKQPRPTADIVKLAISSVFEVLFGWIGPTESAVSRRYQYGIERAWGLNPLPRILPVSHTQTVLQTEVKWPYSNADLDDSELHVENSTMQWNDLKALYRKDRSGVPVMILNTNIGNKGKLPDLKNLYELTPFWHGNPTLGYEPQSPPLESIAQGVRASAGFADSQGLDSPTQREAVRAFAHFFPSAQWGVPIEHPNHKSFRKLRMSDGGGSDNLGLVSVARRGPRDIIVVDTASDVEGSMADVCWSREALAHEGMILEFDELSNLEGLCDGLFGRKTPLNPKGELLAYNISAWLNPVLEGTIRWTSNGRLSKVWLIKAAWDQQATRRAFNGKDKCGYGGGQVDCTVLMFYGNDTDKRTDAGYMLFPQHSTANMTLDSSSKLFLAYRELGRSLAKNLEIDSTGYLRRTSKQSCIQPSFRLAAGRQPEFIRGEEYDPRAVATCKPTMEALRK